MKKIIFAFAMSVIMIGCVKVIHTEKIMNQPHVTSNPNGYLKSYTIGTKMSAYIGQPMVMWHEAIVTVTQIPVSILIEDDFSFTGKFRNKIFTEDVAIKGVKGEKRKIMGYAEIDGIKYHVINDDIYFTKYGLLIDNNGYLNTKLITDDDYDRGYEAIESALIPPNAHFLYDIENSKKDVKVVVRPGGMSRELIFGGVNNVSINVTYREYTPDNMARQAFFQNIIYQTSADTIRFQNFKIKVHEVTNEKIVFTVIEDGLAEPTP